MSIVRIPCTWSGQKAHFSRPGKKIRRCLIKDIVFKDGQIAVQVYFQLNHCKKKCLVSPISIAALQLDWMEALVCSDSDDNDDDDTGGFSVSAWSEPLPTFDISDENRKLIPSQLRMAFKWVAEETNNHLEYRFRKEPAEKKTQ